VTDATAADRRFVEHAVWMVIGRPPSALEIADMVRPFDRHARYLLMKRLLTSVDAEDLRNIWRDGRTGPNEAAQDRALQSVGSNEAFVQFAYDMIFDREADASGLAHYTAELDGGKSRISVVQTFMLSDEFARRLRRIAPQNRIEPRDIQLCELANPAKWDNPDWMTILRELHLSPDRREMHRKGYEFTQLLFGCRRLGALGEESRVLSVGAGREAVLYWLANHAHRVVATDLYEGARWQDEQGREGDPVVIAQPDDYAPFPYRREHLVFMRMDGTRLAFRDGTFDVAYSLSSIEHFGGLEGARAALGEMGRVLKSGGILALATEYRLSGPPHPETFGPEEFSSLIDFPDFSLVEPLDDRVYRRYDCAAIDLHENPYQTPHLLVRFKDTVFTTVMVFLRKR
jgi:SAM-dependent methyltransferase